MNRFFHILHGEYLRKKWWLYKHLSGSLRQIFEGSVGPNVCTIWVKNGEKLIIFFKNFTLVTKLTIIEFLSVLTN